MTRDEVVRGRRVVAMPSKPEHGDRHFGIDYVLGSRIRPGYVGSTDLITRFSHDSDFATDTCIRRAGTNPQTGERYLEEVAFEIVNTQSMKDIRIRAEDITGRGVRRFFAVFVKKGYVGEWSGEKGAFLMLDPQGQIEDEALIMPLSVRALLDAAEADNDVARALLAKKNPVIEAVQKAEHEKGVARGREEGREQGRADGVLEAKASAVLAVLGARGLAPSAELRHKIAACRDARTLDRWLEKAATASSAAELTMTV